MIGTSIIFEHIFSSAFKVTGSILFMNSSFCLLLCEYFYNLHFSISKEEKNDNLLKMLTQGVF